MVVTKWLLVVLGVFAQWEEETAWFQGVLTHISLELMVETMLPFPTASLVMRNVTFPGQEKWRVLCALAHILQTSYRQKLAKYFFSHQEIKLGSRPDI